MALLLSRGTTTAWGAYAAFVGALLVWGWNEMAFLLGFVTGPRTAACPAGCGGWRHFGHAVETLLYHELALAVSALAVLALTAGAPNPVGAWTFLVLWAMRLSTKLNVFLGVPNLSEEFLPEQLRYLRQFFTRKPMNLLFPLSVTLATVATALVVQAALDATSPGEVVGRTLVAALMGLAVLEHWFLVLPLPSGELWRWGLRSRQGAEAATDGVDAPGTDAEPGSGKVLRLHGRGQDGGAAVEEESPKRRRDR